MPRLARLGLALALFAPAAAFAGDGLALTPPMGWNSWNKFGCNVSEKLIRGAADALVATGMKDAGYTYIVIDDCWQVSRDGAGKIVIDAERFPAGMKALADYVHSKGLKFDWCHTEGQDTRDAYGRMSRALRATARPIVFSLCEWGSTKPWTWAQGIGHLWRAMGDIQDCWYCGRGWGGMGVTHIIDIMADLYPYAGPGHWNDPDMLEVGNSGLNLAENRAHFSFWCLFAAPLMAGNDLEAMKPEIRDILTNAEAIAVDQDPLGMQGRKVWDNGPQEAWMKPLADGSRAVILFNRGTEEGVLSFRWEEVGLFPGTSVAVRDLWAKKDLGTFTGRFETKVGSHDVAMLKVTAKF